MAQAIQYNGDNATAIKELFKHLEVEDYSSNSVPFLWSPIGHIYLNDWAVIDSNDKYSIYRDNEYQTAIANGQLKP